MSSIKINNESSDTTAGPISRPAHHLHNTDDPLPGAKGGEPTVDYSKGTMDRISSSSLDEQPRHISHSAPRQGLKENAFTTARPLDVQPTSAGGVAISGRDDLPEGHADLGDKIRGKTEKVAGKIASKPEMHERGELRETGGKAAVHGEARAAHD